MLLEEELCILRGDGIMAVITVRQTGNFNHIDAFFKRVMEKKYIERLKEYGQKGADALSSATPIDTGKTASLWSYEILQGGDGSLQVVWTNSNINKHVNIAIILQTGHGTRNGGYVKGRDYINPAIQPIFDEMTNAMWEEVTRP